MSIRITEAAAQRIAATLKEGDQLPREYRVTFNAEGEDLGWEVREPGRIDYAPVGQDEIVLNTHHHRRRAGITARTVLGLVNGRKLSEIDLREEAAADARYAAEIERLQAEGLRD